MNLTDEQQQQLEAIVIAAFDEADDATTLGDVVDHVNEQLELGITDDKLLERLELTLLVLNAIKEKESEP